MKLFNTMSRQVEDFVPQNGKKVSLYTCGPTVYLDPHIGNWKTFINYDLLVRTLTQAGYEVDQVLNITDVGHLVGDGDDGEDKMAKTATEQRKTAWEIAEHYTSVFYEGLKQLNITPPSNMPKATDHIQEQIDMIKVLEEKGFTYTIDDGVYFDTSKCSDYGKLARLDLEGQQAGARVQENAQKRNPQDFALWKLSPKDQKRDMEWDSPWGTGFPGWHIECSAMALKYLGATIDIHGGGIDHIPIHHTNEIAQSESANGVEFSKFWFHSAFIDVDSTKMSKSLDNFYTIEDIKAKNIDPMAFRMLVVQAHYRKGSNFTWEALEAAAQRLKHLRAFADLVWQGSGEGQVDVKAVEQSFVKHMQNDLNTPAALEVVSNLLNQFANRLPSSQEASDIRALLGTMDEYLGLKLSETTDIDEFAKQLLLERENARQEKNWEESDRLRVEIEKQGLSVNDTPKATIWSRTS